MHISNVETPQNNLVYLNKNGCCYFGKLLLELRKMVSQYLKSYVHPTTLTFNNYLKKILNLTKSSLIKTPTIFLL